MIWTQNPSKERTQRGAGLSDQLLAAAASFASYLRARLELAELEGKEAAVACGKVAAFLLIAIGLLAFGYTFFWIGVIAMVSRYTPLFWGWMVLAIGVLHFVGAMGCLCAAKSKWGTPVFPATLDEFRKDEEWLNRLQQPANRN